MLRDGIEKYDPENKDFHLPEKLIDLIQQRDFDEFGENEELVVCFIASNHTTGGNSGSPVLNDQGHLIGINFDRNWEGLDKGLADSIATYANARALEDKGWTN